MLLSQYSLGSVFDAYYATALKVPDHIIVSADEVFDGIPGITRIDPRRLV